LIIPRWISTAQRTASTTLENFDQHAGASGLDDAPVMLPDFRVDEIAAVRLQAVEGAFLIRSHQPRVTRHIGGEDRRKAARCSRGYDLTRSSPVIGDAAVDESAPFGHLSAPLVRGTFKKSTHNSPNAAGHVFNSD
jgi:hypothetical protein